MSIDPKPRQIGNLSCQIVDALPADGKPQLVVILCHGFGAPGTDLVGLGPELLGANPNLGDKVRFIFPAAPLSLDEMGMYGGRAWWHLDVEKMMLAIERGEFRNLRNDYPDGLDEARRLLTDVTLEAAAEAGLPLSKVVLGGFSQGSMLAVDVGLRLPEPPAALCVLSGSLLCEQKWRELASARGPLPILQSHGRQDPILPFEAAGWLRDLLTEAGMQVDFVPFDGMHTIPLEALQKMSALLEGLTD